MFSRYVLVFVSVVAITCFGGCGRSGGGDEPAAILSEIEARIGANVFAGMRIEKTNIVRTPGSYSMWVEFSVTAARQAEFLKSFPEPIEMVSLDSVGVLPTWGNPEWWRPEDLPSAGIGIYASDPSKPMAMTLNVMASEQPPPETRMFVYVLLLD